MKLQIKVCLAEALKSTQEDRHLAINLETARWDLADAEKELKWLKSALSSSEKEYDQNQRNITELQMELDTERLSIYLLNSNLVNIYLGREGGREGDTYW